MSNSLLLRSQYQVTQSRTQNFSVVVMIEGGDTCPVSLEYNLIRVSTSPLCFASTCPPCRVAFKICGIYTRQGHNFLEPS